MANCPKIAFIVTWGKCAHPLNRILQGTNRDWTCDIWFTRLTPCPLAIMWNCTHWMTQQQQPSSSISHISHSCSYSMFSALSRRMLILKHLDNIFQINQRLIAGDCEDLQKPLVYLTLCSQIFFLNSQLIFLIYGSVSRFTWMISDLSHPG